MRPAPPLPARHRDHQGVDAPVLSPIFEKRGADADQVSRRFLERVAKNLSGEFG
jgi:hypothetical protein